MSFENACFISYRSYREDREEDMLVKRFVEDLYFALANEMRIVIDQRVFLDKKCLQPGVLFNEELAKAICKSVCMIVVFTPRYFLSPYCAREYKAMEQLEQSRLELLGHVADQNHGLIIPLVFRGLNSMPQELKSRRHFADFSDFTMASRKMSVHPKYAQKIKELAEYIHARCTEFENVPHAFDDCATFSLPNEEDIKPWLATVARPTLPFVNR